MEYDDLPPLVGNDELDDLEAPSAPHPKPNADSSLPMRVARAFGSSSENKVAILKGPVRL